MVCGPGIIIGNGPSAVDKSMIGSFRRSLGNFSISMSLPTVCGHARHPRLLALPHSYVLVRCLRLTGAR